MERRHTRVGREHDAAHKRDPEKVPAPPPWRDDGGTGKEVSKDQLDWRDENDKPIPYHTTDKDGNRITNVTYGHEPPVVKRWNEEGQKSWTKDKRYDDYNDPNRLKPQSRSDNCAEGGELSDTYDPPEDGYT